MSGKTKEWEVPYRATFRGTAIVDAETAKEALALVNAGGFDDDLQAERVDWEASGRAREANR